MQSRTSRISDLYAVLATIPKERMHRYCRQFGSPSWINNAEHNPRYQEFCNKQQTR